MCLLNVSINRKVLHQIFQNKRLITKDISENTLKTLNFLSNVIEMKYKSKKISENRRSPEAIYMQLDMSHLRYFQRRQLEYALSQDLFQHVEDHCLRQTQQESQKAKDTQIKKFDNLLKHNSDHRNNQPPPSQWVVNLSSKQLSQPQESVLAKCLNYALPPKQIPTSQIVASAEEALRKSQAPEETTSKARSQIIGVLKKAKPSKPNLSVPETKALRELHNDDSIMILPADKGHATVVMNK